MNSELIAPLKISLYYLLNTYVSLICWLTSTNFLSFCSDLFFALNCSKSCFHFMSDNKKQKVVSFISQVFSILCFGSCTLTARLDFFDSWPCSLIHLADKNHVGLFSATSFLLQRFKTANRNSFWMGKKVFANYAVIVDFSFWFIFHFELLR